MCKEPEPFGGFQTTEEFDRAWEEYVARTWWHVPAVFAFIVLGIVGLAVFG